MKFIKAFTAFIVVAMLLIFTMGFETKANVKLEKQAAIHAAQSDFVAFDKTDLVIQTASGFETDKASALTAQNDFKFRVKTSTDLNEKPLTEPAYQQRE